MGVSGYPACNPTSESVLPARVHNQCLHPWDDDHYGDSVTLTVLLR